MDLYLLENYYYYFDGFDAKIRFVLYYLKIILNMDYQSKQDQKSDADLEMMEQLQQLRFNNQMLKNESDRLQKLLDEVTSSNDSQRICECGRKLRYMSVEPQSIGKHCSKCDKIVGEVSRVWWRCQQCNYNACRGCQGYKRCVCPFSHFLQIKPLNPDIIKQEEGLAGSQKQIKEGEQKKKLQKQKNCDVCLANINSNYYSCTCGFDMCKPCRDK